MEKITYFKWYRFLQPVNSYMYGHHNFNFCSHFYHQFMSSYKIQHNIYLQMQHYVRCFDYVNSFSKLPIYGKDANIQTPSSSNYQQDAASGNRESIMWMIIAILFLVVAILLAITSIALGIMLYHSKKTVKSVSVSNLTPHQGLCFFICVQYMYMYMCVHALFINLSTLP